MEDIASKRYRSFIHATESTLVVRCFGRGTAPSLRDRPNLCFRYFEDCTIPFVRWYCGRSVLLDVEKSAGRIQEPVWRRPL